MIGLTDDIAEKYIDHLSSIILFLILGSSPRPDYFRVELFPNDIFHQRHFRRYRIPRALSVHHATLVILEFKFETQI